MTMPMTACCLLIDNDPGRQIPLEGVRVDARLDDRCARVTVVQSYRNTETIPVEAVYVFPLDEGAAVCGFEAVVDGHVVEGRVEEREAAFDAYDDALMEGHTAMLVDGERPDVFTASVGNLPPGGTVELRLSYVTLASQEGAATRLTLPTTIAPRYTPADAVVEVGQPDAERIDPPRKPNVPYGLELEIVVSGDSPLAEVESPTHPVRTELTDSGATVRLSQAAVAMDRDFVLLVRRRSESPAACVVAAEGDGTRVAMVTFRPEVPETDAGPQGREVVFVVDCSGSMGGAKIEQARQALALCLRGLDPADTFEIVRFGSQHDRFFGEARPYTEESLARATRWLPQLQANMGGTEILEPLQVINRQPVDPERPRQLLLLTDGQVSNEDDVIALCREHRADTRVFTFGIGAAASAHMVRGAARAGGGASEMIAPQERIEPKVLRTFGRLRTPVWSDVEVDWGGMDVEVAPAEVPPVFAGDVVTLFARIRSGAAERIALSAGGQRWELPLDLESATPGGPVPQLWARQAIRDLEDGRTVPRQGSAQRRGHREDRVRARIVELGTRYQLASRETSWVAVHRRTGEDRVTESAVLRKVPVAMASGWGGLRSEGLTGGMAPPPAPMARFATAQAMPLSATRKRRGGILSRAAEQAKALFSPGPAASMPASLSVDHEADEPALYDGTQRFSAADSDGAAASDRLYDLLLTQGLDGHFELSEVLDAWLGDRADAVRSAAAADLDGRLVTSVVLALLARDESARRDEWRAAADKAGRWLDARGSAVEVSHLIG